MSCSGLWEALLRRKLIYLSSGNTWGKNVKRDTGIYEFVSDGADIKLWFYHGVLCDIVINVTTRSWRTDVFMRCSGVSEYHLDKCFEAALDTAEELLKSGDFELFLSLSGES